MATKKSDKNAPERFTKEQLIKSQKFAGRVDLLNVLVADDESLTVSEAENKINKFMKGTVK